MARRDPPAFAPASGFRSWRQASNKAAQQWRATTWPVPPARAWKPDASPCG